MLHDTELIGTVTAGLVAAFIGGFIAVRLRLPPIVGYLVAGIAVGPFTPGYVGDAELAPQLAEIGVILLMFGVGLHFSVRDLLWVRSIAIPGAVGQITVAMLLGTFLGMAFGWSFGEGLVLGLAISVASTVVLVRALSDRDALTSSDGRIAVGWVIVEDVFTVLALVFLPVLATSLGGDVPDNFSGGSDDHIAIAVPLAIGKIAFLAVFMLVVGARVIPWLLLQTARSGSRELFTLAVLAGTLGIAFGSALLFDVSLALGAFLAGLVVSQSDQSHQAAADALPLRDAFAVLFFVSVGMLFDPHVLLEEPVLLGLILAVVVAGKSLVALAIVLLFKYPLRTGLVVAAGLAQIGEFSFILADMGHSLDLLSEDGKNLVLATALLSITINPFMFWAVDPISDWAQSQPRLRSMLSGVGMPARPPLAEQEIEGHAVLCGFGRIGSIVGQALDRHAVPYAVIEQNHQVVEALTKRGVLAIYGDAANEAVLAHARVDRARVLIAVTHDWSSNRRVVEYAQRANPGLHIVVRTRNAAERTQMRRMGIQDIVMSDVEVALTTVRRALPHLGISDRDSLETIRSIQHDIEQALAAPA